EQYCRDDRGDRSTHVLQANDDLRRSSRLAGRISSPDAGNDALCEVSSGRHHRIYGQVVQGEVTTAVKDKELPNTMVSPQTGETLRRGVRPFVVAYKGKS